MPVTKTSGQGRPKGAPNKVTIEARKAIAAFVDANSGRLQDWLDQVANGVKVEKKDGSDEYVVAPNPEKAFALFQSVIEYHVPKLGRTIVAGDPDAPVQHNVTGKMAHEVSGLAEALAAVKAKTGS